MSAGPLTSRDYDMVAAVVSDCAHLADTWSYAMDVDTLRRETGVLRRLLTDGDYSRAWRLVGLSRQPLVRASRLEPILDKIAAKHLMYAVAAPTVPVPLPADESLWHYKITRDVAVGDAVAVVAGAPTGVASGFIHVEASEAESNPDLANVLASVLGGPAKPLFLYLDDFLKADAVAVGGHRISRRNVLKYAASRLQSVHTSEPRGPQQARDWPVLDHLFFQFGNLHALHIEVISTALAVVNSADCYRLSQEFGSLTPPDGPFPKGA